MAVLNSCGYEPRATSDGRIELCNCPFHAVAQQNKDVVCDLNLHLIHVVLDGGTQLNARAELDFQPNRCCLVIHNAQSTWAASGACCRHPPPRLRVRPRVQANRAGNGGGAFKHGLLLKMSGRK